MTQSQIAERIGVSQMQVSRLIRRALARLRTVAERPSLDRRALGLGQALRLVLAQEALEQAAVALLVVEDRDHHVVGDGVARPRSASMMRL